MKAFSEYQNIIEKALNRNEIQKGLSDSRTFSGLAGPAVSAKYTFSDYVSNRDKLSLSTDLVGVANEMGVVQFTNQVIGHHPHFSHLRGTTNTEKHYIVSAFIDIKGSTNLFRKYDEETIMIITNTIQLAAINVCQLFGGFIQRIQGDGLFVYFGGKNIDRSKANQQCLTALSFFSYFVKNDLKHVFEQHGIEKIFTRIGVDFGDNEKVLWAVAGKDNTSEIATYSLHTSLAAKMQAYAKSNEIVVGKNVKDKAGFPEDLYAVVEDKRYIHEDPDNGFYYTQYVFDWNKYLRTARYIVSSTTGDMTIKPQIAPIPNIQALKEAVGESRPYASTKFR
jgi:class 3 adenylate cyclase